MPPADKVVATPDQVALVERSSGTRVPVPDGSIRSFVADRRFVTLFLVDVWERFSFYGMQALLFLYAVTPTSAGGLGLDAGTGAAVFGLYLAAVFAASLPGGWISDHLIGPRWAMVAGAVTIAAGHYVLAVPLTATFGPGLALVAIGTGLLKPSLPVVFGMLYPRASSSLRETAFTLFYTSIQVSALIAPLVTGYLGERINWHVGFGAAAIGMTIGLLRLLHGLRHDGLGGTTAPHPAPSEVRRRVLHRTGLITGVLAFVLGVAVVNGKFRLEQPLGLLGVTCLVAPVVVFRSLLHRPELSIDDRRRLHTLPRILLPAALFWMLFSQLGSTFVLFAQESTNRSMGHWQVPATWFQSLHPLFVLAGAPLTAALWLRLGERARVSKKLGAGLLAAGAGFGVLALGAARADTGQVSAAWLMLAYLGPALGELTFGPVGLNATVEAAPGGYPGQVMSLYFVSAAGGAVVGAQLSRLIDVIPESTYFAGYAVMALVSGLWLVVSADREESSGDDQPRSKRLRK